MLWREHCIMRIVGTLPFRMGQTRGAQYAPRPLMTLSGVSNNSLQSVQKL